MEEVIFLVEESDEGGYIAKGMGVSIFTEADNMDELRIALNDAVDCHFKENNPLPKITIQKPTHLPDA